MFVSKALRYRHFRVDVKSTKSASGKEMDGLPELKNFKRRWRLLYPLPPKLESLPEVLTGGDAPWPVKILRQSSKKVVLKVYPDVGREIVQAFIGGALWHALPKVQQSTQEGRNLVSRKPGVKGDVKVTRGPGKFLLLEILLPANKRDVLKAVRPHLDRSKTRLFSWSDYQDVFRAVDLRRKKIPRLQISQELWPGQKKTAQSVLDLETTFRKLAAMFGVPL